MALVLAALIAAALLAGCVSMDGPCQIDLRVDENGQAHRGVQCEAGGSIWMLAPKDSIEAAGKICQTKEKP
jgi:hypothetical protein